MSVDQLPPARAPAPQRGAQLVRYDEYIDKQIESTRRMVKTIDVMTALLTMATATLGFLLTAAIVEHWLIPGGFNLGVRLVLFVALVGGLSFFATRRLWPLVAGSINPAYAAHTIEQDNPSLKNSLLNLLLFRQHRDDVTDAVYETLEEQAAKRLTRVPIDAAVDRTQLLRLGYVLVAIVAAVALYKILSPKDPFITAERVLMPWARIVPPSRVSIDNVEPGAVTLARGEVLTISADVRGIGDDDPVVIKYTTADGQALDRPAPMTPTSAGLRFTGQLPPASDGTKAGVAQNLKYRIEAGDARSLEYAVTVVAAPTITVQRIDYDYPEYTGFVDRSVERLGDIRAIEGTRVTIHARANSPIEEAFVDFEADGRRDLRLEATGSDARATFTLELREDRRTPQHTSYVLRFTGADGRPNRDPVKFPIDVTPDNAPEVSITAPAEKSRDIRLDETVAIEVDAIDSDFALGGVRLHGESAGKPVLDEKLLTKEHTGRFRGRLLFTPIEHNLKSGDVVRYWFTARDNRTPTANETSTDSQTLRIVGGAPQKQGQRKPNQNGEQNQEQQNGDSQQGEQQPGEGGESGDQGSDSSQGNEQGESAPGESASADGSSNAQGDQSSTNQSGDSNESESNNGESNSGDNSSAQSKSGDQSQPGGQQQPGESSESGAGGERSDQNQSQQPGGDSKNQPGENNQPGEQGEPASAGGSPTKPRSANSQSGDSDSSPVSSDGDNDGEAFERIREFMNREGQLPKEGESESGESKPSEADESNPGESASGEPASAGGSEGPKSEDAQPNQSGDNTNASEQKPDDNTSADAESRPAESADHSGDHSQPSGDQQNPEGQHTSSEGESGAGQEPQQGQGSPESQQPGDEPDQWQQKPSGDKQGNEQEAPSGGRGDRKNDSQGDEGGDRSGGGEEGAGQKSEREGTGSSGQNQSADEGAGESSEQGAGENSSDAGQDAKSNDATGQSGSDEKGKGSAQKEGEGEQPGGAEQKPGEPASAGGEQPATSPSETKPRSGENESNTPNAPESNGEQQQQNPGKQNPGNQPGSTNRGDGAGQVPEGVIPPSGSSGAAPDADAANLEYARRETDLVLENLDEQMKRKQVDQRLLDQLGWTEADLKRFLDRWGQLKEAARDDSPDANNSDADDAKRELDDALRSLGLRRGQLQQAKVKDDTNRDLNQGYRGAIPLEYQERLRAYNQGVSRAQQSDE